MPKDEKSIKEMNKKSNIRKKSSDINKLTVLTTTMMTVMIKIMTY